MGVCESWVGGIVGERWGCGLVGWLVGKERWVGRGERKGREGKGRRGWGYVLRGEKVTVVDHP